VTTSIVRHGAGRAETDQDLLAVEAPVTLRLTQPGRTGGWSLGVLMRTPGYDEDLVHGLLAAEGLICSARDVLTIERLAEADSDTGDTGDSIVVTIAAGVALAESFAARATVTTSACGLCGRLEMLRLSRPGARPVDPTTWPASLIASLPDRLTGRQAVFAETGGLHAAGLFDAMGALEIAREDVGRHNAVDKVVGAALRAGLAMGPGALLAVSGRAAYEIVQKAVSAGVAGLVAVGAPSSLAVEAARAADLTLAGFTRDGRFNVYAGPGRVR
jgi:FdhD protein